MTIFAIGCTVVIGSGCAAGCACEATDVRDASGATAIAVICGLAALIIGGHL